MAEHLLEVENLKMYFKKVNGVFRRKTSYVKAVDNISFTIDKKETFGLVGESGCGKTTTGRALIRLYEPTAAPFAMTERILQSSRQKNLCLIGKRCR